MRVRRVLLALALLAPVAAPAQEPSPPPPAAVQPSAPPLAPAAPPPPAADADGVFTGNDLSLDVAVLGGLDKVTARVVTIEAPVGRPVHFGTLEIVARACMKRRPEENPESAAFLDVWDLKSNEPAQSLFRGWMFASSPALSAMEHPIYDIWVLDCRGAQRGNSP